MKDQGLPISNDFHSLRNVPPAFSLVSTPSPIVHVQPTRTRLTRQMLLSILDEVISLLESDDFTDQVYESEGSQSPPSNGHRR